MTAKSGKACHIKSVGAGIVLLMGLVLFSTIGPLLAHGDALSVDIAAALYPPMTKGHLLGTDRVGRDILTLLMMAGRVSLWMAFTAVFIQMLLGITLGLVSGYCKGWADRAIMSVSDIFLSMPVLLVLLLAAAFIGELAVSNKDKLFITAAIIGGLSWPSCARIIRSETRRLKSQSFVLAAKANGVSTYRIMTRYILPNLLTHIAAATAIGVADALAAESLLSFLGLGASPPLVSWGAMIRFVGGVWDYFHRPWLWLGAGMMILLCVMALHLIGEGLSFSNDNNAA